MKTTRSDFGFFLALCGGLLLFAGLLLATGGTVVSANEPQASEKKADEKTPPLIRGFQFISDKDLRDGWLLLFDGKTFFGWEAEPLIARRPLAVPDPKIRISGGKMSIETRFPIRVRTLFTPVFPWALELVYQTDEAFEGEIFLGVPAREGGKSVSHLFEIPLEASAEPKTISIGVPSLDAVTVNGHVEDSDILVEEKGLTLLMTAGRIDILSCRWQQKKTPLFDGESLTGWKTSGRTRAEVDRGTIHLTGGSGNLESEILFSDGVAGFEFREKVTPCNSGFFFRTIPESAMDGYECQMNNAPPEEDRAKFLGNDTGSIFRRAAARRVVADPTDWTAVTLMADGNFFRTWVNGIPTLLWHDTRKADENPRKGLRLEKGSFQFQGHDPTTDVSLREIAVAATDADEARIIDTVAAAARGDDGSDPDHAAFSPFRARMESLREAGTGLTDFHIHLRGGMTAEKALARQEATGIGSGILENAGREWPLSDNESLEAFIDEAERIAYAADPSKKSLAIGIQVNDRDWHEAFAPELLARLDYVLADTMIMGTDADGKPQRLWLLPADAQVDLDTWMEEYMEHYRRILDEPITILANPTYLPKFAEDRYDELWTDERMDEVIEKAVQKGIALEIQAESPFPNERFLRKALERGAKISFGTNNSDPVLKKLDRWEWAFEHFDLNNSNILQKEDVLK
ncbi:MAG: family 16 glycoside hydrolase [Thermoguttaceae bacterium]|jgi:histidinol phosphatase-like PHP family hydrolase